MSVLVKALCRAGCGDLGDPELDYLCVDCHGDQIERRQQEEFNKYMAKEAHTTSHVEEDTPISPRKHRGPRPVDHAKALDDFLHQHREQNSNAAAGELTFLKREIAVRETAKKQLRKYMVETDEEQQVDPKEWTRYELGPPNRVPTHEVEEAVELAAQLKLYCRWRKRVVQKRIEARRHELEAERLALKKHKKKGIHVGLLSLRTLRGSTKTAVAHASPEQAKQDPATTNKRRPILSA
ncbi:hypothetical protein AM587_10010515 [Phytophthora nicotianae]|nr:hypothetical protein AM587_10014137 [Phytophthora nicotianae]KUF84730.1 hypothetical protein AM587_10010515 [Phytophthora nicotianae]